MNANQAFQVCKKDIRFKSSPMSVIILDSLLKNLTKKIVIKKVLILLLWDILKIILTKWRELNFKMNFKLTKSWKIWKRILIK